MLFTVEKTINLFGKKYVLNVNDITNIDSVNVTVDYIRNVTDDLFGDNNDDTNDDSFKTYTDKKC